MQTPFNFNHYIAVLLLYCCTVRFLLSCTFEFPFSCLTTLFFFLTVSVNCCRATWSYFSVEEKLMQPSMVCLLWPLNHTMPQPPPYCTKHLKHGQWWSVSGGVTTHRDFVLLPPTCFQVHVKLVGVGIEGPVELQFYLEGLSSADDQLLPMIQVSVVLLPVLAHLRAQQVHGTHWKLYFWERKCQR